MPLTTPFRTLILFALLVFTNFAAETVDTADEKPLIIFAASSLTAPLSDIAKAYEAETGTKVILSFGSSSALARQLSMGAPGRVFISAHKKWISWFQENIKSTEQTPALSIAQNGLVLATRVETAKQLGLKADQNWDTYFSALGNQRLIIGQPDTVPLGQYTFAYLQNKNLWDQVKDQLAPARDALGAVMLLKSGQSPLAILYQNDVVNNKDLMVLKYLYRGDTSPIHYYALKVGNNKAPNNIKTQSFIDYLTSTKASTIFCRHGLTAHICANTEQFQ